MDDLSRYVLWAKDFKLSDDGVQAFQAIRKLERLRDILVQGDDDALDQVRAVVIE